MAFIRKETVSLETSGGATTQYTAVVNGYVHSVRFVNVDITSTAVITVAGESNGQTMLNAVSATTSGGSWTYLPRDVVVESSGASTALAGQGDYYAASEERLQISVTGAATSASFTGSIAVFMEGG